MLFAILAVQVLVLLALVVLIFRRPSPQTQPNDARLEALLIADLPGQLTRVDSRATLLDEHLRGELNQLRGDARGEAERARQAAEENSAALRREVLGNIDTLGKTLREGLDGFRGDNRKDAETLRGAVDQQLKTLSDRFINFTSESTRQFSDNRTALDTKLTELGRSQGEQQEKLRGVVEKQLDALGQSNEKKLEQMRQTVDEKLHATLQTRLTESFGQVTDQLTKVHAGLGEMNTLAAGVGDLKKVLSNVKSRGIVGEFFLGQQLEQMFAPDQYIQNARIKAGTQESVEFALKVPNGPDSTVLLALDSKFPIGDWERLEAAHDTGNEDERKRAGIAFERAIKAEGKRICEKYIDPPNTLPFAIMYLPTEALYAEVMRRPGLHAEVQSQCNVVIAGPSAFTMILTSFQLVFRTLKFQKNLNQVWEIFQVAQKEFEKFGGLMEKVESQVGTVQRTLKEISGKTKTVNRAFKNASKLELGPVDTDVAANVLPLLAAEEED